MSEQNNAAAQDNNAETNSNALADPQATDKFLGFATKDGERINSPAQQQADGEKKGGEDKAKVSDKAKEPDDGEEGEESESDRRHRSAQERINKAIGRQRAAERRAAALEQRLAVLEAQVRAGAAAHAQANGAGRQAEERPPNPKDYQYGELDAQYIRDLARFETRQEMKAVQNNSKQEEDKASNTKAQQEFQARLEAFYHKGLDIADDFEDVVSDPGLKISPVLGELILESEYGPQIAYAMASDPKEAKAVSAMSPARQAAWFGQKEAELSSESSDAGEPSGQQRPPNRNSPKTTQAPPPPRTKPRGSGEAQQVSPATTDFKQFERLAMKQQE